MVERIIQRCIDKGFFLQDRPEGEVYSCQQKPKVIAVNGTVEYERGFHMRPIARFISKITEFGIDKAYVVFPDERSYGHSRSIISLTALIARQGDLLTIVSNHQTRPEQLIELYNIVTGKDYQEGSQ